MNTEKQCELFAQKLSGNISAAEEVELQKWLQESNENTEVFAKATEAWSVAGDFKIEANTDKAWSRLKESIEVENQRNYFSKSSFKVIGIAAVLLLLVGIGFLIQETMRSGKYEQLGVCVLVVIVMVNVLDFISAQLRRRLIG